MRVTTQHRALLGLRNLPRSRGQAGFSLTEMLATMLIMVMVTTMVVTGMPAARDAYLKTVNASNAQVALSTTLTALRSELGTASKKPNPVVSGNSLYYLSGEGCWVSISNDSDSDKYGTGLKKCYYLGTPNGVDVSTLQIDTSGGGNGVYDLIPSKSITDSLRVDASGLSFDATTGVVTIGKVAVTDKLGQELAKVENYQIKTRG